MRGLQEPSPPLVPSRAGSYVTTYFAEDKGGNLKLPWEAQIGGFEDREALLPTESTNHKQP